MTVSTVSAVSAVAAVLVMTATLLNQRSAKGKRNEKNQIWLKTQNFLNVHRLKCQYKHLCPEVESSFGALQWPYGA